MMRELLKADFPHIEQHQPVYQDFRAGDVRHSQADISKAQTLLGFAPTHTVDQGLGEAMAWYKNDLQRAS